MNESCPARDLEIEYFIEHSSSAVLWDGDIPKECFNCVQRAMTKHLTTGISPRYRDTSDPDRFFHTGLVIYPDSTRVLIDEVESWDSEEIGATSSLFYCRQEEYAY